MQATVNGITYEGTEDEIRRIVSNPPPRPAPEITCSLPPGYSTSAAANTVKCTHCGKRVDTDEAHYITTGRGTVGVHGVRTQRHAVPRLLQAGAGAAVSWDDPQWCPVCGGKMEASVDRAGETRCETCGWPETDSTPTD